MKLWCSVSLACLIFGATIGELPLGRRLAVPVLRVRGSHYDIGFDTGRTFSGLIKSFLSSYENLRQFEREYRTEAGRAAYDDTLRNMKRRFPQYVREMQGLADGAAVPFTQLFLLQMDDVIGTINDNHIPRGDTGGCSSLGFNRPGHGILGHTEDAFAETLNHFYILSAHVIPTAEEAATGAKEERFTSLCYAGHMPGYTMGFNEHGLVFSINTLSPRDLKPSYTPRTFITRSLLSARSRADAERILRDEGLGAANGFSVNMLWTNLEGRELMNVEVAPDFNAEHSSINVQMYDGDATLVHCNMYQRLAVDEVIGPIIDSSQSRLASLHARPPPRARADVAAALSDTSGKIFPVFQDRDGDVIKTIAVGIFDLENRTWSLYIDAPASSEPVAVLPIHFS